MTSALYNTDFQITLLICLLRDPKFYEKCGYSIIPEDFGMMSLRLIFELARNYRVRYGALPAPGTLLLLVDAATRSPDPEITTTVPAAEADALIHVLQRYLAYQPQESETAFYESQLQGFLAYMRWELLKLQGHGADQLLEKAAALREDIVRVNTGGFSMVDGCSPIPDEERSHGKRHGLGPTYIDVKLAGGLMRKQMGLIGAGTGVGKTTSMCGAMAYGATRYEGSLYITLEMNASRIQERYQGILAGIPASYFKQRESTWPEQYRKRYAAVLSPGFKLKPYGKICDMSKQEFGITDIEKAIVAWKHETCSRGLDADAVCTNVYVDWLDRLGANGLQKVNKNSSEERVYFHIMERAYQIANKHNIIIWFATQCKPEAKGKEVLNSNMIAWGNSKLHLCDAAVGLATCLADQQVKDADTGLLGENEEGKAPECDRLMNVSMLKTRDTSAVDTTVSVYQDPTLRLWNTQAEALRRRDAILRDPYDGIHDLIA